MRTQIKLSMVFFKALTIFLLGATNAFSQSSKVKPLTEFVDTYKEKHAVISKEIETRTDISFAEKLAIHTNKINKLKDEFRINRKSEYLSKSAKRAKRHSCTGKTSRGKTDCGYAYVKAPNDNMYTKKEWVKTEGNIADLKMGEDNTSVGIKMVVTGKGTDKSTIYAIFKYKPELVDAIVDFETNDLFSQIIKKQEEAIGSAE